MGSDNFFSKIASIDPLAQALNLPGAHKYAQSQAQARAGQTDANGGAYTGVAPTLAGANAGYAPGGPGATVGFAPTQPSAGAFGSGILGGLTKAANLSGNLTPQGTGTSVKPAVGFSTVNPYVQQNTTINPYVTAARGAAQQGGS
jgi:hypothetical protein